MSDQIDFERATDLLRARRARVTSPRVRVLAELLAAEQPLTHLDVQRRIERAPAADRFDRVTLYRVLDWLIGSGLAHRVTGPDRVSRFSAMGGEHGHFRCTCCARMFCMTGGVGLGRIARTILPDGFTGEEIELTVSGRCADCAAN